MSCWDNAAMESFFSTMKTERTARRTYATRDQARADLLDYIERFYNPRHRHSTLGPGKSGSVRKDQEKLRVVSRNSGEAHPGRSRP